jgi:hypothetical protein
MPATLLADLLVAFHLAYVGFVVFGLVVVWLGALLRWSWVRRPAFRLTHLVCTLIVPLEALNDYECPLTTWERDLRRTAGQTPEEISFVGRMVREVLFHDVSPTVLTSAYVVFGLLVLATLFLVPLRRRGATVATR